MQYSRSRPVFVSRSRIAEVLDMVERGCERLMKCGGGFAMSGNRQLLTKEDREEILRLFRAGKPLNEIAAIVGRHYSTICRVTLRERLSSHPQRRHETLAAARAGEV